MTTALEQLYQNLQDGKSYGKYHADYEFPCFHDELYVDDDGRGKQWIYWCHYGSSAEENTLEGLELALKIVFNMTAEEFLEQYHTRDEYKEITKVAYYSHDTSYLRPWSGYPTWNFFCKGKDGELHFMKVDADDEGTAYEMAVERLEKETGCEPETYGLFKVKN